MVIFLWRIGSGRLLKRYFRRGTVRIETRSQLQDSIDKTRAGPAEIGEGIDDIDASALNRLPPYRQVSTAPGGVPQAEWLAERVISLPMHPYLGAEAQDFIIATVRQALASAKTGVARAAE